MVSRHLPTEQKRQPIKSVCRKNQRKGRHVRQKSRDASRSSFQNFCERVQCTWACTLRGTIGFLLVRGTAWSNKHFRHYVVPVPLGRIMVWMLGGTSIISECLEIVNILPFTLSRFSSGQNDCIQLERRQKISTPNIPTCTYITTPGDISYAQSCEKY